MAEATAVKGQFDGIYKNFPVTTKPPASLPIAIFCVMIIVWRLLKSFK
jgi:hypothetical protein